MKREIKVNLSLFNYLLTILFIGLKLTQHISWSWLWVLSPLWLPYLFMCACFTFVGLMMFLFRNKIKITHKGAFK